MEDDNGLELSLGLSCGGSSGKSIIKDASLDPKVDEGSNRPTGGSMTVSDPSFKNLFQTGSEKQDQKGKQKTAPDLQQHENFWTDLGKSSTPVVDHSNDIQNSLPQFNMYRDLWASNNKTVETEEDKSNKRKMPFVEINIQNKHEKVLDYADAHGKSPTSVNLMRSSRVSVTTEDACSGVNDDVAESETEGSNSGLVSQNEGKSKSSDIPKFSEKYVETSGVGPHGQKESSLSGSHSNHELANVAYGIPLLQPSAIMTVPCAVSVTDSAKANGPNAIGFSSSCGMQPVPAINSEHPTLQAMSSSNLQLSFGYSPIQLPTLETGSSWAFTSRNVTSFRIRDGTPKTPNSDILKTSHVSVQAPLNSSAGTVHEDKSLDLVKSIANNAGDVGSSSSQDKEQSKGTFPFFRQREKTTQSVAEGISHEGSTIRPGIASDVKFGGSGSYPDLPWVSTTGPNGRTISGVTYKYNQNEVRIVCACHGTHMSPEKFVQHASADIPNPENNTAAPSFPSSNSAASAKS